MDLEFGWAVYIFTWKTERLTTGKSAVFSLPNMTEQAAKKKRKKKDLMRDLKKNVIVSQN